MTERSRGSAEIGDGRGRFRAAALTTPAATIVVVCVIVPAAVLIATSFTAHDGGQGSYAWLGDNPVYLRILARTIGFSALVTALCAVLAYPLSYLVVTSRPRTAAVLLLLIILPMWSSMLVRVFAWLVLMERDGVVESLLGHLGYDGQLLGTRWAVVIAMVQLMLPFMAVALVTVMREIDGRLVQAAASLGANPTRAWLRVFLPLSMPGLVAGSCLVFLMSLGFYLAPALLGSPSDSMLAQTIYQQIGVLLNFGRGGALAVVLLSATASVLAGMWLLRKMVSRSWEMRRA